MKMKITITIKINLNLALYFLQEGEGAGAVCLIHMTSSAKCLLSPSTDSCHLQLVSNAYLMLWVQSLKA